jgi:hypothetical protein
VPPPPEPPPPEPAAAPEPPPAATDYAPKPTAFSFADQVAKPSFKAIALRPATILFTVGAVIIGFAVWYLNYRTSGPDLPTPVVSYTLLPNEGKTKGVPVAIRVNQLTVFMIDDPTDTPEGATRAKTLVATLDQTLRPLTAGSEVRFAVETVDGRPVLLEIAKDDQRRTLATVTQGDITLAGETDGLRVAALWAERFTDAVKVFVFGEAPSFSTGTDFGQALLAMHKAAIAGQTKVSKKSLDRAFTSLTPGQRLALESPPIARR